MQQLEKTIMGNDDGGRGSQQQVVPLHPPPGIAMHQ